jgi:branched-chain amino acid transport system permease protein
MALLVQVLVSGLAAGGVYGLVAVGHTLVFRLTGVVHLALGDLISLAVFTTLVVAAGTGPTSESGSGLRFWLAVAAGLAVCVAAGAGGYVAVIQPYLARGWTVGWVAGTLALGFAIRALVQAVLPRSSYVFPDPFGIDSTLTLGDATVEVRSLVVIAVVAVLAVLAGLTLERTRFGRGLRAIADDAEGAHFVGVPVERLVVLAFALVGGLAALAALAAAPGAPFSAGAGALLGVKGLLAALVVGFASPSRALAAGAALGVAEAAVANLDLAGPSYSEVLPLAVALLVLALRPFADAVPERE